MSYHRPVVVMIDREENRWYIVDFPIPMDYQLKEKEEEKIDRYMELEAEVGRQFKVEALIVPIVSGALAKYQVPAKPSESLIKSEKEDVIGR